MPPLVARQQSGATVVNERPADVQSRSVTEPQRESVVYDDGGDKKRIE